MCLKKERNKKLAIDKVINFRGRLIISLKILIHKWRGNTPKKNGGEIIKFPLFNTK